MCKMITKICEQCGGEYEVYPSGINRRFCSYGCSGKWKSENMAGENSPCHKPRVKLTCKQCGREYEVIPSERGRSRFCSIECKNKWISKNNRGENNPRWNGGNIVKVCEQCGGEYEVIPYKKDTARFCSRECKGKWQSENQTSENSPCHKPRVKLTCKQCGREYEVRSYRNDRSHFCSHECHDKWRSENMSGEHSHSWKGGASFEPYCPKFNEAFKEKIRELFDRTCILCNTTEQEQIDEMRSRGKRSYKLSVHHVSYNKDCLCDDSDCEFVPLCIRCHAKTNHDREYWEQAIMDKLSS